MVKTNGEGLLRQPRPHGVAARARAPLGLEARPVASEVVAPHRLKPRGVVRLDAERAWVVGRLVNELASSSGRSTGMAWSTYVAERVSKWRGAERA